MSEDRHPVAALCEGRDVTIDTNVLAHSVNIGCPEQESAFRVVAWMAECDEVEWVLDDQGKSSPDPATSLLYAEYNATLSKQSFPLQLLAQYFRMSRVTFAPRPGHADRTKLKQLLPRNVKDRAVLGAAIGSDSRVLISNDSGDFTADVREKAQAEWGATVLHTDESTAA